MQCTDHIGRNFRLCGCAAAALAGLLFAAPQAVAGGISNDPFERFGPRWSNSQHHERGLMIGPDCVALPPGVGAEYVPNRDPWGNPVLPAEQSYAFEEKFPAEVELDVYLDDRKLGGHPVESTVGDLEYDPASDTLTLNGRELRRRDCVPSVK